MRKPSLEFLIMFLTALAIGSGNRGTPIEGHFLMPQGGEELTRSEGTLESTEVDRYVEGPTHLDLYKGDKLVGREGLDAKEKYDGGTTTYTKKEPCGPPVQTDQDGVQVDTYGSIKPGSDKEPPTTSPPVVDKEPPTTSPPVANKPDTPSTNPTAPDIPPSVGDDILDTGNQAGKGDRYGTSPLNPKAYPGLSDSFQIAKHVGDRERGIRLVNAARKRRRALEKAARGDDRKLGAPLYSLPLNDVAKRFKDASRALLEKAGILSKTKIGLESGEIARFANAFRNASDKAAAGLSIIDSLQAAQRNRQLQPFRGLLSGGAPNPFERHEALQELFGTGGLRTPLTNDGLVNRLVMFQSLTKEERETISRELSLREDVDVKLQDGSKANIELLHNGYLFHAGKSGVSCSSLISSILPTDVRKGYFTTLDFFMMWYYRKKGIFLKPPTYDKRRAKLVAKVSKAFIPVDLYKGERLLPGDLLVYRIPSKPSGHAFVVTKYDSKAKIAKVIEASQSAGTIRERDFWLSVYPLKAKKRYLRPGLLGLRLKKVKNNACSYEKSTAWNEREVDFWEVALR